MKQQLEYGKQDKDIIWVWKKWIKRTIKKVTKPISKVFKGVAKGIAKVGKSVMRGVAKLSKKIRTTWYDCYVYSYALCFRWFE